MKRRHFLAAVAGFVRLLQSLYAAVSGAAVRKTLAGRRLMIVPYSHMDWAWVHRVEWQSERAALVLGEALDILRAEPRYRFFVDTWHEFAERFLDREPGRGGEFRAAVASGRLAICGGTVCNQHPGWMEAESLIRNMTLGRRLFRTIVPDFRPEIMVHYDVTPGPSQMPQILLKAGYRGFRTCRPDESLTAAGVPRNFSWVGLDGASIPVSRGPYGGLYTDVMHGFAGDWDGAVSRFYENEISGLEHPALPALVWLPMGADDSRPLHTALRATGAPEEKISLLAFVRYWNDRETIPLDFGTPVDFFRELEKEAPDLPVWRGPLDESMWTFWYGLNGNQGLRIWRSRADRALVQAEAVWSCVAAAGSPYPESRLEELWLELLRCSSHAQMWLFEQDYQVQLNRARRVADDALELRGRALKQLAAAVQWSRRTSTVLLWNPLPWDREEVVQVWASFQDPATTNFVVRDAMQRELPFQVLDVNHSNRATPAGQPGPFKEALILVKVAAPALGYTVISFDAVEGRLPVPAEPRTGGAILDAGFARIRFSAGGIEAIADSGGVEYPGAGNVVYRETRDTGPLHYGPVVKTLAWSAAPLPTIAAGPLRSTFRIEAPLGRHSVRMEGHLYPHANRISFMTTIESAGGSGHFMTRAGLPGGGALAADVHFGVEKREPDRVSYAGPERLRKNVFYGAHWVDYAHARGGLTMIGTTGEKGYEWFPEGPALGHFLLMTLPPAKNWERFVTRARAGTGSHTFDYQLLLHAGGWREANVPRRALEAMHPLVPVAPERLAPGDGRHLPERLSFIRIEPDTIQISAVAREGRAWRLRVFECAGTPTRASLTLPFAISSAAEVDFHGDPRPRILHFSGHTLTIDLKAWEIVTLNLG